MAAITSLFMAAITSLFMAVMLLLTLHVTEAKVGVCYGMLGDNLPCSQDVVDLYEFYEISAMRLYAPDQPTLKALKWTDIRVMLGVPNENITSIASDQSKANEWVETNVAPYVKSIKYIIVGNEIHPNDYQASSMEPAMQNLQNALISCHLGGYQIKVSTAIDSSLITNSYPPSRAEYKNLTYITPIIKFLTTYDSPLFVNIQVYTSYMNDPKNIRLDYALFTACGTVFTDEITGLSYQNLFDAIYDATYVATQKVADKYGASYSNKPPRIGASESEWPSNRGFHSVVESRMMTQQQGHHTRRRGECGWPPEGSEPATVENAETFYRNLIKHVKEGTPLTRGQEIETYLFAMFDENRKPGDESERHYGLFTPDGEPKYGILDFSGEFEYY